ncbi:MAG: hypothetical protein IPJ32_20835 [Sphingobacteriaceae bacterium]|nr:hypothetical protein [Sphingobacteriaceae bacterium]
MHSIVCFSKIKDEIISNLKNAKKEIKVAVAWLTDEDIIRVLTQRKEAGIDVQIAISDSKENFKNTSKFKDFLKLKGKLYVSTTQFLHHKFCIIDDNVIINGSYNWSYPARTNEENILVLTLEQEDSKFLKQFNVKHEYLCKKCSVLITDIKSLNNFKDDSKDRGLLLAQLDETEIHLREEFERDVKTSFDKSVAAKIQVSHLLLERMKSDGGGVEFVKEYCMMKLLLVI